MPRYIDADALLSKMPDDLPYKSSVKRVLMQAQEADVAPKSEVERLEAELAEWHNLTQKSVSGYIRYCEREAVKNFTEEFEEDCLDFPMKETDIHLIVDNEKYAELKKKYTEGE